MKLNELDKTGVRWLSAILDGSLLKIPYTNKQSLVFLFSDSFNKPFSLTVILALLTGGRWLPLQRNYNVVLGDKVAS
jgi:hypothetical protein